MTNNQTISSTFILGGQTHYNSYRQNPKHMLGYRKVAEGDVGVIVNKGKPLRARDDPFGRRITDLRKSFTDNDTRPLKTKDR